MTHNVSPHVSLSPAQTWGTALRQLQLQMTRDTFDTHLKSTSLHSATNGTWQVAVASEFAA